MFSQSNASHAPIDIDFSSHPVFIEQEEAELAESYLSPLKRETNAWRLFFGSYPTHCAFLATEKMIEGRIGIGDRHVVGIKIAQNEERMLRRDVVRKIGEFIEQLDKFGLEWNKTPGTVTVYFDYEQVVFKIYVCDDSEMFHILAYGNPNETLNKIIYSVRVMFQDNDPLPGFQSIKLTPENWEETYNVTREQTTEFVSFPTRVENIGGIVEESSTKKRRIA